MTALDGSHAAGRSTSRTALAGRHARPATVRVSARAHWPLAVLVVGYPLWWLLGLANIMPILVAIPMARQLIQRHPLRVPSGFGLWLVFLLFVVVSTAVLWVDAPGAVPGGGSSRLIVFSYRLLWYLAITIVLLWVGNLSEVELPTPKVVRLMSWMFVVTVGGGLLGVVLPRFEVTSLAEMLMPGGLRSNSFVRSIVHPSAANESRFLGRSQFRPMAPYSFANSWGANYAMFLPFFAVAWMGKGAPLRLRRMAPLILVLSAIPVVYSLNRGLWLSLAMGVAFVVVRFALVGRVGALVFSTTLVFVGIAVFLASPLGALTQERLENAHSNDRRGALLSLTVSSTLERSPVVGYGSTRDVQGSFASIAGGDTPDCSACSVPPLGTQGTIWLVIFSQGFVGAAFFVGFFAVQAGRHLGARTPVEAIGMCLLLFLFLQIFIYDLVGLPLFTLMVAIGLMWRLRAHRDGSSRQRWDRLTLETMLKRLRRHGVVIAACVLLGAVAGTTLALRRPTVYNARGVVLLAPAPVYLDPINPGTAREITVDTEAAMVFAESTINATRADAQLGASGSDLRDRIFVTAPPLTKVLNVDVRDTDPARAERTAASLVRNYLAQRAAFLEQRRSQTIAWLQLQLDELRLGGAQPDGVPAQDNLDSLAADELQAAIDGLGATPSTGGDVLRIVPAARIRAAPQVDILSGALLGLLAALVVVALSGDRPQRSSRLGVSDGRRRAAGGGEVAGLAPQR